MAFVPAPFERNSRAGLRRNSYALGDMLGYAAVICSLAFIGVSVFAL